MNLILYVVILGHPTPNSSIRDYRPWTCGTSGPPQKGGPGGGSENPQKRPFLAKNDQKVRFFGLFCPFLGLF